MDMKVTKRMRQLAPDLCDRIDKLRKDRQHALQRICYLRSIDKGEDVAEVKRRIAAIDVEIAPLHAAAKEKLIEGVATELKQGAVELRNATRTNTGIANSLDEEIKWHSEAVKTLAEMQRTVGGRMNDAIDTMHKAVVVGGNPTP